MKRNWKAPKDKPQIFISYASEDRPKVEKIYTYLSNSDFLPWMDTHDIVSGVDWLSSITQAISDSDFFLACLSSNSVDKPGVIQEELRVALEICQKIPDHEIFLIPIRLDDCLIPEAIQKYQWVDLFKEDGWVRLLHALHREKKTTSKIRWSLLVIFIGLIFILSSLLWKDFFPEYEVDYAMVYEICDTANFHTPVKIGVVQLPESCPLTYQEYLIEEWNLSISDVTLLDIPLSTITEAQDFFDYDLVVWGECNHDLQISFVLNTSHSPFEVYEPGSLETTGNLTETAQVGKALINYQSGNYAEAVQQFTSSSLSENAPEQQLVLANSLLFAQKYEEAIATYKKNSLSILAGEAYNNLGVARFNLENLNDQLGYSSAGIAYFEQAIESAEMQGKDYLAALAHVNKSELYRYMGNWGQVKQDCENAQRLAPESALFYICNIRYNFSFHSMDQNTIPLGDIERDLVLASQNPNTPPIVHYLRGYWYVEKNMPDEAIASFEQYFTQMRQQVCLTTDYDYLEDASRKINELQH